MRATRRRLLLALGIPAAVLVLLLVLFCVLVFNPFEGTVDSIAEIVPKGVAFYAYKAEPGTDAQRFLASPFLRELEAHPSYQAFLESESFRRLDQAYGIRSNLQQLITLPQHAPIDLYTELLGSECVLAGYPRNDKISRWDFLLYTRVGWKVRAGVDWSGSDLVASRLGRDISISEQSEHGFDARIRRGGKDHHLYYGRVKDVLVLSNRSKLLEDALRLGSQGPALSLKNDVEYQKAQASKPPEDRSSALLYADATKLRHEFDLDQMLEGPGVDPLVQVATKVFGLTRVRSFASVLTPVDAPKMQGVFVTGPLGEGEHERRITSAAPMERETVESLFDSLVPTREFFFGFVKCPATDLFALMSTQFSDADRKLINDHLRKKNTNLDDFLKKTASRFGDQLAVSLSRIDPRPNGRPRRFPAITIYFQVSDDAGLEEFVHFLTDDNFAIEMVQEKEEAGSKYYVGRPKLPLIAWAKEQVAYARVGDRWVLSSREEALAGVLKVHAGQTAGLFQSPAWKRASSALAKEENGFGFLQMEPFLEWAKDYVPILADKSTEISPARWQELRAQKTQEVQAANPGLPEPDVERQVEDLLEQIDRDRKERLLPRARRSYEERIEWARLLSGVVVGVSFGSDRWELRMALDLALNH